MAKTIGVVMTEAIRSGFLDDHKITGTTRRFPENMDESSGLIEVPTDEDKVTALRRVGVTVPDAVFGNSIHDAAMLAIARRAFPITPSPALAERSLQEGWPVYYPVSVAV